MYENWLYRHGDQFWEVGGKRTSGRSFMAVLARRPAPEMEWWTSGTPNMVGPARIPATMDASGCTGTETGIRLTLGSQRYFLCVKIWLYRHAIK